MEICAVTLAVPTVRAAAIENFYGEALGLRRLDDGWSIGTSRLAFEPADGAPFYHFAFLVPGNRFDAALGWAQERVSLLRDRHAGGLVTHFRNWDADACYFHDPAGNIVELIAHRAVAGPDRDGDFGCDELLRISEIGLVGEPKRLVAACGGLGLEVFPGDLGRGDGLVFLGEPTATLIVSACGRGWLPLGRPAEVHPVHVVVAGSTPGTARAGEHDVTVLARAV
jgi:D-alanyl-D-alanine carboxypeptidase